MHELILAQQPQIQLSGREYLPEEPFGFWGERFGERVKLVPGILTDVEEVCFAPNVCVVRRIVMAERTANPLLDPLQIRSMPVDHRHNHLR